MSPPITIRSPTVSIVLVTQVLVGGSPWETPGEHQQNHSHFVALVATMTSTGSPRGDVSVPNY